MVKRALCRWSFASGGRFQWSLSCGNRRRGWLITCERGVIGQKGQTPHVAECTGGCCSDEVHMEEEMVEVKVQEEEVEDRERETQRRAK